MTPGGSSTVHIYTQTVHRTVQWTQKRTHTTIRIHKNNNKKYLIYELKQKYTKHTTIYTMINNGSKRIGNNMINEKVILAANFIWSIYLLIMLETLFLRPSLHFTQLHFTSLHVSALHFLSFKLHPTALHFATLVSTSVPLI